jgi:NADP-dependent 3-hydroxy acid dehydrogenase YdfG
VDPVTLLVTALATGAAAGIGETTASAVKDAYAKLKSLVAARFAGDQSREVVLAQHEKQPEVWGAPLTQAVTDSGAATDPVVVEAAQRLLALLDEAGSRAGKYTVDLRGAQGVQVGDHNTQTNTFTNPPTAP